VKLAATAHQNAKDILTQLRSLARGIHPQVLDRGLGPAAAGRRPPGRPAGGPYPAGAGGTSLITQGRSNAAIAGALFISPKVVEKHVASIFDKLGLAPSDSDNRRVIAAVRYLEP
jgi:hypothetical protein